MPNNSWDCDRARELKRQSDDIKASIDREMNAARAAHCWNGPYNEWIKAGRPLPAKVDCVMNYCDLCFQVDYHDKSCTKYKQEIKMTRREAERKVRALNMHSNCIELFEALGLIKFEEEKIGNGAANCIGFSFEQLKSYSGGDLTGVGKSIIEDLKKSGYIIVKAGDYVTVTDGRTNFNGSIIMQKEQS